MSKFATRFPDDATHHTFDGELRVLSKQNEFLYDVEIELLDDRVNANKWQFLNLEEHRPLFAGKPILIAYTRGGRKIGDGHNQRMVRGKDGKEYATFTDADSERIIGSLSDNADDVKCIVRDGHTWIVGKGTIWAWYAAEAVEKIASQGRMSVSIETIVTKNHMEGDVEIEERYEILGVSILGDDVPPAVKGAHIRLLSEAAETEFKELKLRAASYNGKEPTGAGKPASNTNKGVKSRMSNKKLREQMQTLFPDYDVLDVSPDERNVMLCSKRDGEITCHVFGENEPGVVLPTRFQSVNANVSLTLASGYSVDLPLEDMVDTVQRQLAFANGELAKEKKLREDAKAALKSMRENETKRRRAAVKSAARAELAKINATLAEEDKIDDKVCESIDKAADEGEYENAENKEGEWCGEEKACAALNALCTPKLTSIFVRMNQKQKPVYAWNNARGGKPSDEADDDVSHLLSTMGVDPELK